MVRATLARFSLREVSLLLTTALLFMICGLVASDSALSHAAQRQAEIDALQSSYAVSGVLRNPDVLATAATYPTLRSIVQRAPGERRAVALIAGRETVIVVGKRDALRGPLAASVRVEVPDTLAWTLVVAHQMTFEPLRIALWVLSLLTVALLGYGLIRERRQTVRVAGRSAELERLYSEVARANTAKSEFLANISHELRTPLNAIVGFVELLKDGVYGDLTPRQVPPVDRIAASATHLRHLVDQVLDIAKIAAGRLEVHAETIVLRPFVLNVASELESLVNERGLSFSIAVGASLPRLRTDPTHLRQILVNLIGNAIKYTPAGGVAVRGRLVGAPARGPRRPTPDDPVLAAQSPDQRRIWVALQVVDTGVGIAPADQTRIFEEFEQVNAGPRSESMQRGTGLGLAISKRLAQLLGGDIRVESARQRVHVHALAAREPGGSRTSNGEWAAAPAAVPTILLPTKDRRKLRRESLLFRLSRRSGGLTELAREFDYVRVALGRLLAQTAHHDGFHGRRELESRLRLIQRNRRLRQKLREHFSRRLRGERQRASQQEIGDRRETVLIRQRTHELARQRFRRDVHQRPDEEPRARETLLRRLVRVGRDAEIEQLHLPRRRIVHHVLGLEIAMHDADGMRGVHGVRDLTHDRAHFVDRQRALTLRVFLEDFARRPFDGEEMHPWFGFADLDRPDDIWMLYALAVARLAQESRDRRSILAELLAQHFHRDGSVRRVMRAENGRRSTFADFALERVAGDRLSYEIFPGHGANLTSSTGRGKNARPRCLTNSTGCFYHRAAQAVPACSAAHAGPIHPVGGCANGQR
jgi:signal transduction histidine kinase